MWTAPQHRPRVTNAARSSNGIPDGTSRSRYRVLRSGCPPVARLRVPTGTRRDARLANVLTSWTKYSLATSRAPAAGAVWGVYTPSSISSCFASLVISRVCGSSVCQQVASQSITRRSRAATSR